MRNLLLFAGLVLAVQVVSLLVFVFLTTQHDRQHRAVTEQNHQAVRDRLNPKGKNK